MNESRAIVTIKGLTVVLPHVQAIGPVQDCELQFEFEIQPIGFVKCKLEKDARQARAEIVQALTDYWA